MKSFLIALGMAGVLFLYGYLLSVAGHDHSAHEGKGASHGQITGGHSSGNGHEHNHDHAH